MRMRIRGMMTLGMECTMTFIHWSRPRHVARALAVVLVLWRLLLLHPYALVRSLISLRGTPVHHVVRRRSMSIRVLRRIMRVMAMAIAGVCHAWGARSRIGS
jgi:hypothetical protein